MIWRHRFVSDRWDWELTGGLLDAGEDPRHTAARELREGRLPGGRLRHATRFQPMVGAVDAWRDVFVGTGPVRVGEPPETAEVKRMEWIPLASAMGLIAEGPVWNADTAIALLFVLAEWRRPAGEEPAPRSTAPCRPWPATPPRLSTIFVTPGTPWPPGPGPHSRTRWSAPASHRRRPR
ncbi:NUDIX domain-containing protein [Streptomyces sp. NPDC058092]|uniref:NUDIX domain-containing protein n=1 Tax=Streptomyces sp. NPDC058092 TaxID=3346336 RepID=UPI0036E9C98E